MLNGSEYGLYGGLFALNAGYMAWLLLFGGGPAKVAHAYAVAPAELVAHLWRNTLLLLLLGVVVNAAAFTARRQNPTRHTTALDAVAITTNLSTLVHYALEFLYYDAVDAKIFFVMFGLLAVDIYARLLATPMGRKYLPDIFVLYRKRIEEHAGATPGSTPAATAAKGTGSAAPSGSAGGGVGARSGTDVKTGTNLKSE